MNSLIQRMASANAGPFEPVFPSTQLTPTDWLSTIGWGSCIAASADGNTFAGGAPTDSRIASSAGAAYVFVRSETGTWSQQAKLTSSIASQKLGTDVSLSDDGNTLAVGTNDGANIYVYKRTGTTWGAPTTITPSATGGSWGKSISISADGTRIVVGAPGQTFNSNANAGVIFVYDLISGSWTETTTAIGRTGAAASEGVGTDVEISGNGQYVIARLSASGTRKAVIFFATAGVFAQQAILTATTGANTSAAISTDGSVAMACDATTLKAVFIYQRNGTNWAQVSTFTVSSVFSASVFSSFGMQPGVPSNMSPDGSLLMVPVVGQPGINPIIGEVYIAQNRGGLTFAAMYTNPGSIGGLHVPPYYAIGGGPTFMDTGTDTPTCMCFSRDGKSAFMGSTAFAGGVVFTAQSGDRL